MTGRELSRVQEYSCRSLTLGTDGYVPDGETVPVKAEHQDQAARNFRAYLWARQQERTIKTSRRYPPILVECYRGNRLIDWWAYDSSGEHITPNSPFDVTRNAA
jgi:hypothetical protein